MLRTLMTTLLCAAAVERLVDKVARGRVLEPALGSVVYCDLGLGLMEHSGIYVGDDTIIHLTRHGFVERCSPEAFIANTPAVSIYVSCRGDDPVGSPEAARRAIDYADNVGWRDYNVVLNNCHMFSEFCLTGEEGAATFITFLKHACEKRLGTNTWRVWDRVAYQEAVSHFRQAEAEAQAFVRARNDSARSELDVRIAQERRKATAARDALMEHVENPPRAALGAAGGVEEALRRLEEERHAWRAKTEALQTELDMLTNLIAFLAEERCRCEIAVEVALA